MNRYKRNFPAVAPGTSLWKGLVVTDYNAIAHLYRETKRLPIKEYCEAFTFFHVLAAVEGLAVLDVACGDGYYTRALKRQGAGRVIGIDSSPTMITYATSEEAAHPYSQNIRTYHSLEAYGPTVTCSSSCIPSRYDRYSPRQAATIGVE